MLSSRDFVVFYGYKMLQLKRQCFHCVKCLLRRAEHSRLRSRNVNKLSLCRLATKPTDPATEWVEPVGTRTGIYIYNTLTKRKDELVLPKGNTLSWYICGPTVYDSSHIGHASNYVRYDIIRRILTNFFDINVIYLMGITDIDDKIITKASLLDQEITAITTHYEREFFQEMLALSIMQPTLTSRVTDYVPEIVDFIKVIIDNGHAYKAADGSIYFDVMKYGQYHKFGGKESQKGNPGVKKSMLDFALWKAVKPGEPFWESPWGPGRPGWHIECSAMASRVFGSSIDIHSGGIDLMFPHHENELAQSCSYHNCQQWANYWMHTGFLHLPFDAEKMSKSLKNIIPTSELLQKYSANQFRMLCILTSYRNNIEFTDEKMVQAVNLDNKIGSFLQLCDAYVKGQLKGGNIPEADTMQKLAENEAKVLAHLRDDFNTPGAMRELFQLISTITAGFQSTDTVCRSPGVVAAVSVHVKRICKKLGFHKKGWKMSENPDNMKLREVLDNTIKFRWNVRRFALSQSLPGLENLPAKERKKISGEFLTPLLKSSDELRSELSFCNICVQDHKTYSSWEFVDQATISDESQWEEPDHTEIPQVPDNSEVPEIFDRSDSDGSRIKDTHNENCAKDKKNYKNEKAGERTGDQSAGGR